jgi:thiosulfate/3-mercaptopyruvate sulfurtransferase
MPGITSPIIEPSDLLSIRGNKDLVLVDATNAKDAQASYRSKHLDGALFVDINTQLADIKDPAKGGRHPLPDIHAFSKTLADLGISRNSHVVIYDFANGANAAARFWWMLKAIGHEKVQVLDGGFQAAEKAGFPVNANVVKAGPSELYRVAGWNLPLTDMATVEELVKDENALVIDVRDKYRYDGDSEPIDLIAGHIPGAINVPFTENMNSSGQFLSPAILKEKYQKIFGTIDTDHVVVHCGSGVTACHTLLAIAHAGLEMPSLYVGSWSEWSRNEKPMATRDVEG